MLFEKKVLQIYLKPHSSEKTSDVLEKNNTYVFKVKKNVTKKEIFLMSKKIFMVDIQKINTTIVKGKRKKKYKYPKKDYKKVYLTLKKGQTINFTSHTN
ncbi:50S ribosomal protein L23 [Candidatus Tachikawaea gelatinosa]|uniref:Large ribosomal subunit protein uL23 n=1 Tax=Candidatus Tachikawaea gelatinosa TaxID=1410383 RepID=A0A090AIW9_9ENTR|nr:50S ribosomal protein L23 [Candidatus Tachikawaea gelatinosa]BAP58373.1 50S ribosomal protein L23 [Candidatus Tachikawaea gelatinosa]